MLPSARQVYLLALRRIGLCFIKRSPGLPIQYSRINKQRLVIAALVLFSVGFFISSQIHLHGHTSGSAHAHTDSHRSMFGSHHQAHAKHLPIENSKLRGKTMQSTTKGVPNLVREVEGEDKLLTAVENVKKPNPDWHIFYYAWYGSESVDGEWRHWNHELIEHWDSVEAAKWPKGQHTPPEDIGASFYPKFGPYSSSSSETMNFHFREIAVEARVGTIVVSWYPAGMADSNGTPELADSMLPRLLDEANRWGLKVAVHIEPYADRTARSVMQDAEYITEEYGSHPALAQRELEEDVDGEVHKTLVPFIYVYDSYHIPPEEWAQELWTTNSRGQRVRQSKAFLVGLAVEAADQQKLHSAGFHAMYTYFAATGFTYGSTPRNWDRMCRFCLEHDMVFIPSVGPGYDDSRVRPWNARNSRLRKDGGYYRAYLDAALKCNADMVAHKGPGTVLSITSYNEWHEGTQIESAVPKRGYMDYGSLAPEGYLTLTESYVQKFEQQL